MQITARTIDEHTQQTPGRYTSASFPAYAEDGKVNVLVGYGDVRITAEIDSPDEIHAALWTMTNGQTWNIAGSPAVEFRSFFFAVSTTRGGSMLPAGMFETVEDAAKGLRQALGLDLD